ncbi:hypothetical protein [Paeniglutamicibacter cryotolerans]|uniref:Uncharacterized protein n=1 Tax=Paeniglutamicibacter cryotolerans TaxID=670079 RepID=A0A839QJJ7_9MICC|nr:hypothetical protein [Paeniglutamicibacter cryotolerans]MBB2995997.1 hypothetical protein [Paeniglutamicibacter cryotolerans]
MTTNPKPQPGNHATGSGRTRFVVLSLGIVVAAALVWMFVGSLNNDQGPAANASDSSPLTTDAPAEVPESLGATTAPESASATAKTPASATAKTPAAGKTDPGATNQTPATSPSATGPGKTASVPPTAAPVTKFEESKPSNWPKGKTTGCTYVQTRLEEIQADVKSSGVEAMRNWLDAIDDLQGDASMSSDAPGFDAVKRTWSTALAAAEETGNADGGQAFTEGAAALRQLVDGIQCK